MATPRNSLEGKVVAISGAARGIGLATATALIAAGAKVAIGDIDGALAAEAAARLGPAAIATALDVTDRESFERFIDWAENELGPIDVLINNAGIMPVGSFVDESDTTAMRAFDVNVHGTLHGMKTVLPRMLARRAGHIVNVASVAGKTGAPGMATYAGTKHALVGITETVRTELEGRGVDFTLVLPSFTNTELTAGTKSTRLVRMAEPEEVAAGIVQGIIRRQRSVYIPKSTGPLVWTMNMLPRSVRHAINRALGADQMFSDIDHTKRRAYDERIAVGTTRSAAAAETPSTPAGQEKG